MGHHSCPIELGDEGIRRSTLPECYNTVQTRPSECTKGVQSHRNLQENLQFAGILEKQAGVPKDGKDSISLLCMDKWPGSRDNEGGQEPAEYNITDYLKTGRNTIAVVVYKYSDGYYLEDQDYWRLAGIFDDVWLFAAPDVHIFDWHAVTDLDDNCINARLDLTTTVKNYSNQQWNDLTLRVNLYDKENQIVKTLTTDGISLSPILRIR